MGILLKCEHADFGYENQDAVVDANLEVNTGDYICIVGENGSGKSTLMKGILVGTTTSVRLVQLLNA